MAPSERIAQRKLAEEVTKLIHGKDKTESVIKITAVLFGGDAAEELDEVDFEMLASFVPTAKKGHLVAEILVESQIAKSKAEARQLISSGAISISGEKVAEDKLVEERAIIKKGKNKFILVR